MDKATRDRLLADLIAGELTESQQQDLVRELDADESFADDAADLLQMHRLIRLELGGDSADDFSMEVAERVRARRDASGFVNKVVAQIDARPHGRRRRVARLPGSRGASGPGVGLVLGVVAVAAAAVLLMLAGPDPAPPESREPDRIVTDTPGSAEPPPTVAPATSDEPEAPARPSPDRPAPRRLARVAQLDGLVERAGVGEAWTVLGEGDVISTFDRIRTHGSRVLIKYDSGSELVANAFTILSLDEPGPRLPPRVKLDDGEAYAEVVEADSGFEVKTPQGRAIDAGTRFGVRSVDGSTDIIVLEGAVEARTGGGVTRLATGQQIELQDVTRAPGPAGTAGSVEKRLAWLGVFYEWAKRPEPAAPPRAVAPRPAILHFVLIDVATGRSVEGFDPLRDGATIDLSGLPHRSLTVLAVANAAVDSVLFRYDGAGENLEENPPYCLLGNTPNTTHYRPWTPTKGAHTITARPFAGAGATGRSGVTAKITVNVIDSRRAE